MNDDPNRFADLGSAFLNATSTKVLATLAVLAMPVILTIAGWVGVRYFEANERAIATLTVKYSELEQARFQDRLAEAQARSKLEGKIEQINEFARDGGRYTQAEADADLERQDRVNQQLASTIERVTDKLNEHVVDAERRFGQQSKPN